MKNTNSNIKFLNKYEIQPCKCIIKIINPHEKDPSYVLYRIFVESSNKCDHWNHPLYISNFEIKDKTRYKRCLLS